MPRSWFTQVRDFVEWMDATLLINYDGKCWEIIVIWNDGDSTYEKLYVKNIDYYLAMELMHKQILLNRKAKHNAPQVQKA